MSNWCARLAILAIVVGVDVAPTRLLSAAEVETPPRPVYLVVESEGLTRETNTRYAEMLGATLMPFKGRMLVQDAAPVSTDAVAVPNSVRHFADHCPASGRQSRRSPRPVPGWPRPVAVLSAPSPDRTIPGEHEPASWSLDP